jgi:hypothetical protein
VSQFPELGKQLLFFNFNISSSDFSSSLLFSGLSTFLYFCILHYVIEMRGQILTRSYRTREKNVMSKNKMKFIFWATIFLNRF